MSHTIPRNTESEIERLLTITEVCLMLGVSKQTIRRWTRDGRLSCIRINDRGDRRFRQDEIQGFLEPRISERPREQLSA